jgi:hypothetical protein
VIIQWLEIQYGIYVTKINEPEDYLRFEDIGFKGNGIEIIPIAEYNNRDKLSLASSSFLKILFEIELN